MGGKETDGCSEVVIDERVRAHDTKAVAGVIRVQKVNLVVGAIPVHYLCHVDQWRRWSMDADLQVSMAGRVMKVLLASARGAFLKGEPCLFPEVTSSHG